MTTLEYQIYSVTKSKGVVTLPFLSLTLNRNIPELRRIVKDLIKREILTYESVGRYEIKRTRTETTKGYTSDFEGSDFRDLLIFDESLCVGDCQLTELADGSNGIIADDSNRFKVLERSRTHFIENLRKKKELEGEGAYKN